MMKQHWRWIVVALSVLIMLFVWKFTKGIDIAWWVEFLYKIDFSKYRELYTNQTEFADVTQRAKDIIIANIRKRVNGLGVWDAEVKPQKAAGDDYIVVRIGGIDDLNKARDIIGKTVELEFALPNSLTGLQQEEQRKKLATDLLAQSIKDPTTMSQIGSQGSNDVYYFLITGAQKEQLPMGLSSSTELIWSLASGEVSKTLVKGLLQNADPLVSGSVDVNWFYIIKSLGKVSWQTQRQLSDQELFTKATTKWFSWSDNFDFKKISMEWEQLSNGIYYNQKTKTILFDLWDPFSWQIAYQVDVYAPSTTWSIASGESVSFDEDVVKKWFLPLVDKKRASSAQLPLLDQLWELTPKTAKIYTTWWQTLIVKIYDKKELSQSLYRSILLTNVTTKELASSFIADLLANDTYNMEVIFVRDQNMWIAAKDSQNRVLNGAYFKFASVSRDQVGRPAVQVDLDDTGKDIFCNITQSNIQKQMAIFVWGVLATAPTIQDKICWWSAIINGSFDLAGAKELADSLNEWALPAKLIQVNESKVSATLWENAWKWALRATLLSFILIFLLMARRYGTKKAFISIIALVSFIIVLIAILKLVWYALSLSGMAAIILNIGMGVDAAILIYERLREEQDKWRSWEHAVYEAYERARPAIFGGQMSTLAIWVLLVLLGSDLFQWFGVVMTLNIVILLIISVPLIKIMLIKQHKL